MFKVEFRKDCKVCGADIVGKRYRSYCSPECRNKFHIKKNAWRGTEWQRAKRDREASVPSPDKCQCLICGKWYVQICTHAYQVHGITGREYRERFELEVKKGVVPEWYRKIKGDTTLENKTYKNLEAGAKFRFVKGDQKAGKYKRSPITIEKMKHRKSRE